MKKIVLYGIGMIALMVLVIFLSKGALTANATEQNLNATEQNLIMLGYCPTMQPIAEKIAKDNTNVILVVQPSSAQALQALKNAELDIALIGRIAKQSEIQSVNERMLGQGYTLVTDTKKFIQENELTNIKVHTAIEENIAKQILPDSEFFFYSTTQEAINQGLHQAVLIDWIDYEDEFELLVIMKGMQKHEDFRIPVLYSKDYNLSLMHVEI
jgi:hypothetical protein